MLFEHIYKEISFAPFRVILYESITIIVEKPSYGLLNTMSIGLLLQFQLSIELNN